MNRPKGRLRLRFELGAAFERNAEIGDRVTPDQVLAKLSARTTEAGARKVGPSPKEKVPTTPMIGT